MHPINFCRVILKPIYHILIALPTPAVAMMYRRLCHYGPLSLSLSLSIHKYRDICMLLSPIVLFSRITAPVSKPVITDAKGIEMRNASGLYDLGAPLTLICTVTQGTTTIQWKGLWQNSTLLTIEEFPDWAIRQRGGVLRDRSWRVSNYRRTLINGEERRFISSFFSHSPSTFLWEREQRTKLQCSM